MFDAEATDSPVRRQWPHPLTDQVHAKLIRDIEQRRENNAADGDGEPATGLSFAGPPPDSDPPPSADRNRS